MANVSVNRYQISTHQGLHEDLVPRGNSRPRSEGCLAAFYSFLNQRRGRGLCRILVDKSRKIEGFSRNCVNFSQETSKNPCNHL